MQKLTLIALSLALAIGAVGTAEARPNDRMLGLQIATQGNQALETIRTAAAASFRAQVATLPRPQLTHHRVAAETSVVGSATAASVRCAE